MRTRAYRPEVPGYLEDRSLLSGVAGLSTAPVILPQRQFDRVVEHMQSSFLLFSLNRVSFPHLREQLRDVAVIIPFGRRDGLGVSIKRIVNRMKHDLSAKVPHAIREAQNDVLAATRAEVTARVQAGDVIVR